ncbi:MAG TPA: COX15/CtaA family protein [Polyangiaceae bacterium]|nr:COX15/CtaA family protein [Polyangiaceae bacterium]
MTSELVPSAPMPAGECLEPTESAAQPRLRGAWLAKVALFYTLFVILFGALVRVTGSGAGCGQHWPTCHGELAHLPRSIETMIELTHRVTSGLSLVVVIALVVVVRQLPPRHLARRGAWLSLLFLVFEALIGAGLVLFELVADDTSGARAVVMPAHLVNTALLMLVLTVTVWAIDRPAPVLAFTGAPVALMLGGLGLLIAVSTTGALTALGDTLYPVTEGAALSERVAEARTGATLLERVRSLHPLLALFAALYLFGVASYVKGIAPRQAQLSSAFVLVLFVQLGIGVLNIWLSAPAWMQIVHLAVANVLWVLWVLLGLELASAARHQAHHADPSRPSGPVSSLG